MATAGYSGTPVWKKIGIGPTTKILLINPPDNYQKLVEKPIINQILKKNEIPDLIHAFAKNEKEFILAMNQIKPYCKLNSSIIIWISWYKKASGIPTDINEDSIRDYALQNDLVDIKVCAVSDSWSGLKLVVPLAKR